jgi:hypothetical protein
MDILHDNWAQGIKVALKAYTRASDAYQNLMAPSVALWVVAIAAGVVFVEWLLGRRNLHG